jgi:putative endopeptidase
VKRHLLSTLALSVMAAFASPAVMAQAGTTSGIDTQFIDPSVRAQDDFFTHLNGKWLKNTEIPSDKASWGTFMQLRDETQPQLRALIEKDAADKKKKAGTDEQKIGDLYTASWMKSACRRWATSPCWVS